VQLVAEEVRVALDGSTSIANVILGDTDGSARVAIAARRTVVGACLAGLAAEIDAQRASSSFNIWGSEGRLAELSLMRPGRGPTQGRVDQAIAGLGLPHPERRYGGIIQLLPAQAQSLREGHQRVVWSAESEAPHATVTSSG
jgi:hypothetical protein